VTVGEIHGHLKHFSECRIETWDSSETQMCPYEHGRKPLVTITNLQDSRWTSLCKLVTTYIL
jgi:hypothetical protein